MSHASIFQWDTLKEVGEQELQHQGRPVPGKICQIALTRGPTIRVWKSNDGQHYFCHGLTFGGKEAPGGSLSPFTGKPVETILQEYYDVVTNETEARPGDILVWRGLDPESTPHSAVLTEVRVTSGKNYLEELETRLHTKNGLAPETILTLDELIFLFGESYNVYRKHKF